jgi:hypothetical protein
MKSSPNTGVPRTRSSLNLLILEPLVFFGKGAALVISRSQRKRMIRGILLSFVTVTSLVLGALAINPASPANALSGSDFNAGYIISDANFFNGSSMNESEVQAFLEGKVPRCTLGDANRPAGGISTDSSVPGVLLANSCLRGYSENIPAIAADRYCAALPPGNRTASQIIVAVSQACGISPKVLIVLLQKEQLLITDTWPTRTQYNSATGFACPDTAPCNTALAGFFKQVYSAARQFQVYTANPGLFNYRVGVNTIKYHPNESCGSSQVNIQNVATANLYIYTPYQPNASALANLNGSGDACGAYGNRNFWKIYSDWFGSPQGDSSPKGNLESVIASQNGVGIAGWVFDPDTVASIDIHVYINGAMAYGGPANGTRPDVRAVFPFVSDNHGFNAFIPTGLGSKDVCVYALNVGFGQITVLGCRTVVVETPNPKGWLDDIEPLSSGVRIEGWTFQPGDQSSGAVHAYVDGRFAGGFAAEAARPDVQSAFPGQSGRQGFDSVIPLSNGRHDVCVYALNPSGTKSLDLGCRSVNIVAPQPEGYVDSVVAGPGGVTATGWAFMPGVLAPASVHVYVDGRFVVGVSTSGSRPDVQTVFPRQAANTGFTATFPVSGPGSHRVCFFAIDATGAVVTDIGCRVVSTN